MREVLTQVLPKQVGLVLSSAGASLVAQRVKNLSAMGETCVQTLGQEDPLEKGKAAHSRCCPGNPVDRGAWWATSVGPQRASFRTTEAMERRRQNTRRLLERTAGQVPTRGDGARPVPRALPAPSPSPAILQPRGQLCLQHP